LSTSAKTSGSFLLACAAPALRLLDELPELPQRRRGLVVRRPDLRQHPLLLAQHEPDAGERPPHIVGEVRGQHPCHRERPHLRFLAARRRGRLRPLRLAREGDQPRGRLQEAARRRIERVGAAAQEHEHAQHLAPGHQRHRRAAQPRAGREARRRGRARGRRRDIRLDHDPPALPRPRGDEPGLLGALEPLQRGAHLRRQAAVRDEHERVPVLLVRRARLHPEARSNDLQGFGERAAVVRADEQPRQAEEPFALGRRSIRGRGQTGHARIVWSRGLP
jgi:hypothetical protein